MAKKSKGGKKLSKEEMQSRKADLVTAKKEKGTKASSKDVSPPPVFQKKVKGVANPLLENSKLKTAIVMAIAIALGKEKAKVAEAIRESGILFKIKDGVDFDKLEPLARAEWSGMGYARYGCEQADGKASQPRNASGFLKVIPFVKALTGKATELDALEAKLAPLAEKAKSAKKVAKKAEAKAPKAEAEATSGKKKKKHGKKKHK